MKTIPDYLIHHPAVEAFGLSILHSLWQGALIAFCLYMLLRFVKGASHLRYLLACGALVCMLSAFGYTFYRSYSPALPPTEMTSGLSFTAYTAGDMALPAIDQAPQENTFSFTAYYTGISRWMGKNAHYIFTLWLAGFIGFSARLGLGLYYAEKLKRGGNPLEKAWQQQLTAFCNTLGIKNQVRLLSSEQVHTPLTLGWLRPVILLPAGMLLQLPPEHLESILLHELAHIKRQDYLVNLLQSVAETLLFFNPAYWYIARVIEKERENACDDMAVKIIQKPTVYARALTHVALLSTADGVLAKSTLGVNRGNLSERIHRLLRSSVLHQTAQKSERSKWYIITILILALIAGITVAAEVKGNEPENLSEALWQALGKGSETKNDTTIDVSLEVDENVDVAVEQNLDLEIDLDLTLEIDEEAMGMRLDSSSLYNYLHSQWEIIKKRKEANGEKMPKNYLLSDKTLYIVDGEASDPGTIQPPFNYQMSFYSKPEAIMRLFRMKNLEEERAAFNEKYPGDFNYVAVLTSKDKIKTVDENEPFTVHGQVYDSKTELPLSGIMVTVNGTSINTESDAAGNFEIRVPNSHAKLIFSKENKWWEETNLVEDYRDRKMYMGMRERKNTGEKLPNVKVRHIAENTKHFTDTIRGTASGIVLNIDKNAEDQPLYFLDGVEVSLASIDKLDPQSLREINVIKNQTAIDLYGERGKNGVVMVSTKKALQEDRVQISPKSNSGNPLFIVDGKQFGEDVLSLLAPNDIASIDVLKGEDAKKIYGEEGVNGVVIINTRSKRYGQAEPVDKESSLPMEDPVPPLFIIDGIRYTFQELPDFSAGNGKFTTVKSGYSEFHINLDPDDIISMNVQSGQPGITASGKKPSDVVIIKTKSGTNKYAEDTIKPTSTLKFSDDNVLFLLDGVKKSLQTRESTDIAKIEMIRLGDATIYQQNKFNEYQQKYPGDYEYVIIATSRNKNLDQENTQKEETYDQKYFNTLHSWFNYHSAPSQRVLTEEVGIRNMPLPSAYDGKKSSISSIVDGTVQNWWVVKPHEVSTVEIYQRNNPLSYFYHVENGYGQVITAGNDKLEYLRKIYPGNYDVLLIITTRKSQNSSNKIIEKSSDADLLSVFPNPSENIFTIRLSQEATTPVQITIFNETGMPIKTLTDEILGQGSHEINWDATTQKAGLYRIRITQGDETVYRNVVVK